MKDIDQEALFGREESKELIQGIAKLWQKDQGRFYFSRQPTLKHMENTRMSRRDAVVINRL